MELSREDKEYLALRDKRVLALDRALMIEQELRDSPTLHAIIEAIGADSEAAMHEFAHVNPLDRMAVSALQARVHRLVFLRETINMIRLDGDAAGMALSEEENTEMSETYE